MTKFRIGGVPEHFNLPWHLAIEEGLFEQACIEVEWTDYPGGTGAMTRELRHGGLDIAIVLTEGMVADIALGNKSKIVSFYTKTPLVWGVHTTAYNRFEVLKDVYPKIFAISRWGSGSHLMAYVYARNNGLDPSRDIHFKVVSNLSGARESLAEKHSNLFLWEKFTTKPFVDSEELKRLGEVPTPWPCFVIAARNEIIEKHREALQKLINIILKRANELKHQDDAISLIASRYDLKEEDVKTWLSITEWENHRNTRLPDLEHVIETLEELNIIKNPITTDDLV